MLNTQAARSGSMSFTQQGLLSMGLGVCLAPFTGGASLLFGGSHLVCGVVYDQFKLGEPKKPALQNSKRARKIKLRNK
jgi:hypothetical protein